MVGDWIEVKDRIYEVVGETDTDLVCREVEYNNPTCKLYYSNKRTIINKVDLEGQI